ncbi:MULTISPECIES: neutral/alkaline non-lysosomal ceramidase N-terminal domain-containing protein [Tsukamurella]|uniref:Neutral ceramidase n=2 Tax=Tsukamurella TaxID=2060 RepID=A0A5C5S1R9_9ACTN|nr:MULTISPECIES: neutral/alkaline non-lysosomal ceramidase N-terminal domain-containing protein [Tsukamurella]NMD57215.1 neutral/alkaline ceramidase [Tsukamurella columbiensis]TWS29366.1 ceramidase [Tsukamurella conjunctivitidis]
MTATGWRAGWAKADITGEPWGVGLMGYGMPGQRGRGLLTRQWARAVVLATPTHRVAHVVADIGMFFQAAVDEITDRLDAATCGRLSAANVVLTATHTHCGPGGHGRHRLYNITTLGHHRRTFHRLVDGVVRAVLDAEAALAPAALSLARGELLDASVNRSPSSFDRNPDRDRMPQRIDPAVTLLRVERDGELRAAIDWFAVHCTSMGNGNRLISSDNKGWAASAWEAAERERHPDFVGVFAQTNAGDMSPNLGGVAGHGPTDDERDNTAEIGRRQLAAARRLAAAPGRPLTPTIDHRITYVDFGAVHTASGPTGRAVLGAAFAAGTSDGLGSPAFHQGLGNRIGAVSRALYRRRPVLAAQQAPKEMFLPAGALGWVQERLPVQLVRLGELHLLCLPVEVTVMAGARLRDAVAAAAGIAADDVLVQGYANGYAHYLTTPEEYDAQRYEAGSTVFGRNQLAAFAEAAQRLAADLAAGRPSEPGTPPPRQRPGRIGAPSGSTLLSGARPVRVAAVRTPGPDGRLAVDFDCPHPNRSIPAGYTRVERRDGDRWVPVAGDDDPSTEIVWRRRGITFRATVLVDLAGRGGRYRVGYAEAIPGRYVWAEVRVAPPRPGGQSRASAATGDST